MENSTALAIPTMLPLTRTCFTSEQDRADVIAAHMRIPVEAGASVTGDSGDKGDKGDTGEVGPAGPAGPKATPNISTHNISSGSDEIELDFISEGATLKVKYDDAAEPTTKIGVLCYWVDEANGKTKVYFTAVAPNANYQLIVVRWE